MTELRLCSLRGRTSALHWKKRLVCHSELVCRSVRGVVTCKQQMQAAAAAAAAVAVAAKIPPPRATLQDRLCMCGAERAGNQALHEHDSGQRHLYWEAHGVDLDTVWLSSRSMEYNAHMRQQRANKERICDTAQHR
jgi:hypothetical protein